MNENIKDFTDIGAVGVGAGVFFTDFLPLAVGAATLILVLLRIVDISLRLRARLAGRNEGGTSD